MLPDCLHKSFTDEIIRSGTLDFIDHDKNGHQDEEEDSNNDASVLSSDEEKWGNNSEDEDDEKWKYKKRVIKKYKDNNLPSEEELVKVAISEKLVFAPNRKIFIVKMIWLR